MNFMEILKIYFHVQGAIMGFFTALTYNCWTTIGKIVRGGGFPVPLPLSTLGCPEQSEFFTNTSYYTNVTLNPVEDITLVNSTAQQQ